ncbi:MAG: phosphoenolpyruvate-protein phosphotransferase PtsP [Gammaproteobacteria bacterium]|nr:MAG: phosphoenolpyruvate-protein phosphotransferase PtsP [Gammaproteobacteria bacterium]
MQAPLQTLRSIFQEAADLRSPRELLELIVGRVRDALEAEVCSIYLYSEEQKELVLAATCGLRERSIGRVRLPLGEGLVGHVAEHMHLLNVADAASHPDFHFFPETGEDRFKSFLGVPIVHFRKLIGVIVVQGVNPTAFSEAAEAFLITIAAQISGAIKHLLDNDILQELQYGITNLNLKVTGLKGAPGIAVGQVVWPRRESDLDTVDENQAGGIVEEELQAFRQALQAARQTLKESKQQLEGSAPKDVLALFKVYKMILSDQNWVNEVAGHITAGLSAAAAVKRTVESHARIFEQMDDPYLRAKSEDIRHIGNMVYSALNGEAQDRADETFPERTVLVGKNLSIADLTRCPQDKLAAVVCIGGSALSHVAVLASALGIPAVMGVPELKRRELQNDWVVVDGYRAQAIFNASPELLKEYRRLERSERRLIQGLDALRDKPAETPDGVRLTVMANTGLLADISPGLERGAEGVGLYRSEIPFMMHASFPSEEEQMQIYQHVLEAYAPRPVHIRTLDVGGDKPLPYYEINEDNPFLGWRGIRFTLDNAAVFMTQIRAMLRANVGLGNLAIMLPMVSDWREVDAFRKLLNDALKQLHAEGLDVPEPSVGVMLEVPAVMTCLDELAERADFFSLGTNDFTQYWLAVDRNNPRVADLYDWLAPSVLRAIAQIVAFCANRRIPLSVCGEMAADPAALMLLMGMGVNKISVSAANLLKAKWVIRTIPMERARSLWRKTRQMQSAEDIHAMLDATLVEYGLDGLTRAGGPGRT